MKVTQRIPELGTLTLYIRACSSAYRQLQIMYIHTLDAYVILEYRHLLLLVHDLKRMETAALSSLPKKNSGSERTQNP